ncbi:MAG: hypothetical protein ACR2PH_09670 [Desulfobulbia bacterium]
MGYETRLYLVSISDYDIPEEGRTITPDKYKALVKEGAMIQAENEPLQRIIDEDIDHKGHAALRKELREDDTIWKPLGDFRRDNMIWAQVIGMVDLCKLGYNGSLTDVLGRSSTGYKGYIPYIFGSDGNSMIFEDCYGEGLGVHDPKEVAQAATKMYEEEEQYRRLAPFIGMVVGALQHDWKNLKILSYGY